MELSSSGSEVDEEEEEMEVGEGRGTAEEQGQLMESNLVYGDFGDRVGYPHAERGNAAERRMVREARTSSVPGVAEATTWRFRACILPPDR